MNLLTVKEMIAKSRSEETDHELQQVGEYRFAVWRNNFADRYDVYVRNMTTQSNQKKISAKKAQGMLDALVTNAK